MRAATVLLLLLGSLAAGCGGSDDAKQPGRPVPATLALDFTPNAVHAGVYMAVRAGLDRSNGVDLTIRAPAGSTEPLKLLANGRADVAILDIHDLGLARERGEDIVAFGALVQRPLAAVIARSDIRRPRELEGRRVGVTGLPSDDAVLRAVVEADGGDFSAVRRLTIGFSAVPSLVAGKVDAVTTFWNAEGVVLRERGTRTREFRIDDFGAPRYPELVIATTRRTLESRPELVASVRAALEDGTRAALADPAAAVTEIAQAADADRRLVRAQFDAITAILRPPLRLNQAALDDWAAFAERYGILKRRPDTRRAFARDPFGDGD